jgi:ATP adenylyltransferase
VNGDYFFSFQKFAYVKGERPPGCILCLIGPRSVGGGPLGASRSPFIVAVNLYPYNPGHLLVPPPATRPTCATWSRRRRLTWPG